MTRETCKALLESGVLQAYADGKKIETLNSAGVWREYLGEALFCGRPEDYRIAKVTKWVGIYRDQLSNTMIADGYLYDSEEKALASTGVPNLFAYPIEVEQ